VTRLTNGLKSVPQRSPGQMLKDAGLMAAGFPLLLVFVLVLWLGGVVHDLTTAVSRLVHGDRSNEEATWPR